MNKIAIFFRKYGHKLFTFFVGLAFLAFCAALLIWGGNRIYRLFKPAHIYEEGVDPALISASAPFDEIAGSELEPGSEAFFEAYIASFVRQNFPDFSDPLSLNPDYFLSYGIWQAIKVNAQGVYSFRKDGSILIPAADVEKYARYNFNYNAKIPFHSVNISGNFPYSRLNRCFRVNPAMDVTYLVPKVLKVSRDEESGEYVVIADCYFDDGMSEGDVTEDSTKFAKRLQITMQPVSEVQLVDGETVTNVSYVYTSCRMLDDTVELEEEPAVPVESKEDEED